MRSAHSQALVFRVVLLEPSGCVCVCVCLKLKQKNSGNCGSFQGTAGELFIS